MPAIIAAAMTFFFVFMFMSLRTVFEHSKMPGEEREMRRILLAVLTAALATAAAAQSPSRPLKIVVPFPPGNGTDILARLMAPKMTAATGQAVIVENRGGANGQIGAEAVAHAAPDGATILFTSPSTHVTAQFLSK